MALIIRNPVFSQTIQAKYEMQSSTITVAFDRNSGCSMISASYDPDPAEMGPQELIRFLEKLVYHLQCLKKEEPPEVGDRHSIWQERCAQTEMLAEQVREQLRFHVGKILDKNCRGAVFRDRENSHDWRELAEEHPSIGLLRPEDYIVYWYANDCFPNCRPQNRLFEAGQRLSGDQTPNRLSGVEQMLMEQLADLLEEPAGDAGFWWFRYCWKVDQLRQIKDSQYFLPSAGAYRPPYEEFSDEMKRLERISCMEELAYRMLYLQGLADSREDCRLVETQFFRVKDELEDWLVTVLDVGVWDKRERKLEAIDRSPYLWTKEPEKYIAFWYVNGRFPAGSDMMELGVTKGESRKMAQQSIAPREKTSSAYRLWEFRQALKLQQQKEAQYRCVKEQAGWMGLFSREPPDKNWVVIPIQYEMQKCKAVIHADPQEGESYAFFYYDPDPRHMDEPALICYMEELLFRLQCLKAEEPPCESEDPHFIWQNRCTQVMDLIDEVKRQLKEKNGFFAYWYVHGWFPPDESYQALQYYSNTLGNWHNSKGQIVLPNSEELEAYRQALLTKQRREIRSMMRRRDNTR